MMGSFSHGLIMSKSLALKVPKKLMVGRIVSIFWVLNSQMFELILCILCNVELENDIWYMHSFTYCLQSYCLSKTSMSPFTVGVRWFLVLLDIGYCMYILKIDQEIVGQHDGIKYNEKSNYYICYFSVCHFTLSESCLVLPFILHVFLRVTVWVKGSDHLLPYFVFSVGSGGE